MLLGDLVSSDEYQNATPEERNRLLKVHWASQAAFGIPDIARGQLAWEDAGRARQPQLLILDTHLLTNKLWSLTLFGDAPAWLDEALLARHYDLHLLLDPNAVPWVDDGQRCQPQLPQREQFHQACRDWLQHHQQAYVDIQGDWSQRQQQALYQVDAWLHSAQL